MSEQELNQNTKLILLYGKSATGKTSLARRLSKDTGIPYIGLDDIKELLYDQGFEETDADRAEVLNRACFGALVAIAKEYLSTGVSVVADLHLREDLNGLQQVADACGAALYTVELVVPDDALRLRRYDARVRVGERHPGHKYNLTSVGTELVQSNSQRDARFTFDTTNFLSEDDYQHLLRDICASEQEGA